MTNLAVSFQCYDCGSVLANNTRTKREWEREYALDGDTVDWGPEAPPDFWPCYFCDTCDDPKPWPVRATGDYLEANGYEIDVDEIREKFDGV